MKRSLEEKVAEALRARGWKLVTAESCTGGLIADRITNIPGSSEYFLGGVVAYDDRVKMEVLQVPAGLLAQYGAVSEETVRAMAEGVRGLLSADIAVSVSGIAGPGGATPQKPLGTTWIGLARASGTQARLFCWDGNRKQNKASSAQAALQFVLDALEEGTGV